MGGKPILSMSHCDPNDHILIWFPFMKKSRQQSNPTLVALILGVATGHTGSG